MRWRFVAIASGRDRRRSAGARRTPSQLCRREPILGRARIDVEHSTPRSAGDSSAIASSAGPPVRTFRVQGEPLAAGGHQDSTDVPPVSGRICVSETSVRHGETPSVCARESRPPVGGVDANGAPMPACPTVARRHLVPAVLGVTWAEKQAEARVRHRARLGEARHLARTWAGGDDPGLTGSRPG